MPSLSVIIIARDEANSIRRCLDSVRFADEIIVFDSGSTDNTPTICREYTDKVFVTDDWPGYGIQKNRALAKASGDWVLSIDADEYVEDALRTEIQNVIQQNHYQAYAIIVRLIFYGKQIRRAAGSDRHVRLFKRDCAHFTESTVHEDLLVQGKTGRLKNPIMHDSFADIDELLSKMNHYSSISAELKAKAGKKTSGLRAVLGGIWIFLRIYFFNLGFLDGKEGLIIAFSFAEGAYYRHMKLLFSEN